MWSPPLTAEKSDSWGPTNSTMMLTLAFLVAFAKAGSQPGRGVWLLAYVTPLTGTLVKLLSISIEFVYFFLLLAR